MGSLSCATCRLIRRFVLAFGMGVFLAWQMTGTLPLQTSEAGPIKGLMMVAVLFFVLSVMMRMRQMRRRWRR